MLTSISSELRIRGKSFDPSELSNVLNIKASYTWNVGDSIEKSPVLRRKDNGWCIRINEEESLDLEEQLLKLLQKIKPKISLINNFCKEKRLQIEFSFGVYIENDHPPAIFLNAKTIQLIASLNAVLDIDVVYS